MSERTTVAVLPVVLLSIVAVSARQTKDPWQSTFDVNVRELVADGASRYFSLDPKSYVVLENGAEQLVITALDETRVVGGVTTRVVEEHESKDGKLVEVSRNFFARHPQTGDVFYFGEEVDIYKNGKVVSHEGAWLAGAGGAKFGLFIPGTPVDGMRFYQEIAPGIALDRVRILTTKAKAVTPGGVFENCVRLEETTPLEPGVKDYKLFAPGLGIVQDGALKLVRHGRR
jgi:hypothetical protein